MSPSLRIALRFLLYKRRAMLMSLAGITFGIALFIVTQAQTSGFEAFFIRTILGTNGAIRIEDRYQDTMRTMESPGSSFDIDQRDAYTYIEGIEHPAPLKEAVQQFENVAAVTEVITGSANVRGGSRTDSAKIFGIDTEAYFRVSDLASQLRQGTLEAFRETPTAVLIGSLMAKRLDVRLRDSLMIEAMGEVRRYTIAGIYETGVSDIDRSRVYLHLQESRSLLRRPSGASFLQISVRDRDRTQSDAAHMASTLQHSVRAWQDREKTWLEVFRALRFSSAITVATIILVSGLGMFNTLAMIVMEKTREIAILRSIGYTRGDIAAIFLWQGAIVLALGIALGSLFGAGLTYGVSQMPIRIRGIFSTDHFVVAWSLWHYISASVTATVIVFAASLLPARRAARLEPGDVIRGTGQ